MLTMSASLMPADAGGAAASGAHRAIATAAGVPKLQWCTAAAAAPLLELECASEQQRAQSPVHAPLAALEEMENHITVGRNFKSGDSY